MVGTDLFVDPLPFYGAVAEQRALRERLALSNVVLGFPRSRRVGLGFLPGLSRPMRGRSR